MKLWGKTLSALFGAAAVLAVANTAPAQAADMGAPVYKAAPVVDYWSPWMIRVRALAVLPRDAGTIDQIPAAGLAIAMRWCPNSTSPTSSPATSRLNSSSA